MTKWTALEPLPAAAGTMPRVRRTAPTFEGDMPAIPMTSSHSGAVVGNAGIVGHPASALAFAAGELVLHREDPAKWRGKMAI